MIPYTIILTALVVLYIAYRLYNFINDKDGNRDQKKKMTARINTLEAEAMKLRGVINEGINKSNSDSNINDGTMPGGTAVESFDEL